jgi:hypothetical protein
MTIDQIYPEGYKLGPKRLLLIRIGESGPADHYRGPDIIEAYTEGKIYLGYRGSEIDAHGESLRPKYFDDDSGSFEVDIIVWKKNEPCFVGKFLEEASKAQPKDKELKEIAQEIANRSLDVKEQENRIREEIKGGGSLSGVLKLKKWEKIVG